VPLVVLCLLIGVMPQPLVEASRGDVAVVAHQATRVRVGAGLEEWPPPPIVIKPLPGPRTRGRTP
jgi:hypothetical protein